MIFEAAGSVAARQPLSFRSRLLPGTADIAHVIALSSTIVQELPTPGMEEQDFLYPQP